MTYRILRYTTSCLMAALLAASCTKVVEEVRTVPEIPISWQAVQTKAVVPYPVGSSFVSYAWFRLPEGEEWEEGGNDPELYIDKAVISHHDDGWHAGSDFIWPPEGTLSFYSYAPADMPGITVSADGISLSRWSVFDENGNLRNIDFMEADPALNLTAANSGGGVPTLFRHKLTRVRVQIYAEGDTAPEIEIRSITLTNIYCTGDYSGTSWGSTSTRSELKDITIPEKGKIGEDGWGTAPVIMLPQNLTAVSDNKYGDNRPEPTLTIVYHDPSDPNHEEESTATIRFNADMGSAFWEAGHDITYTVTFGDSNIPIGFDASVEPWTAGMTEGGGA